MSQHSKRLASLERALSHTCPTCGGGLQCSKCTEDRLDLGRLSDSELEVLERLWLKAMGKSL